MPLKTGIPVLQGGEDVKESKAKPADTAPKAMRAQMREELQRSSVWARFSSVRQAGLRREKSRA